MDKIKNNIEHNLPIYLIIIAVVVIFCIITFGNKNPSETVLFDTSSFNVVTSKDVLEFLDEKEARMIDNSPRSCFICFIQALKDMTVWR